VAAAVLVRRRKERPHGLEMRGRRWCFMVVGVGAGGTRNLMVVFVCCRPVDVKKFFCLLMDFLAPKII
jgi:hypothetical protein